MPWVAFPFQDKRIQKLSELYEVEGIPMLVIVDPTTGKVITEDGRSAITGDPKGDEFPWYPKPLNSVDTGGSTLNSNACLLFIEDNLLDDTKATLNTVATSFVEKWKKEGKEQSLYFFFGSHGNMAQQVKDFSNVKTNPAFFILDIPNRKKYVHAPLSGQPTEADFRNFVEGFLAGTITSKGLKE